MKRIMFIGLSLALLQAVL